MAMVRTVLRAVVRVPSANPRVEAKKLNDLVNVEGLGFLTPGGEDVKLNKSTDIFNSLGSQYHSMAIMDGGLRVLLF